MLLDDRFVEHDAIGQLAGGHGAKPFGDVRGDEFVANRPLVGDTREPRVTIEEVRVLHRDADR